MAYLYHHVSGRLLLRRVLGEWHVHYQGRRGGRWNSPRAAATAVAARTTGHDLWDRQPGTEPRDLTWWQELQDNWES